MVVGVGGGRLNVCHYLTGSGPEIDRHREWPREMGAGQWARTKTRLLCI